MTAARGSRPFGSGLWLGMRTAGETLRALSRVGLGRLVPIVLLLLLIALVLAILGAAGPLAPFVYPLF